MNAHASSLDDMEHQPKARGSRRIMNSALWILQVAAGAFFAGSGFGKVLLSDAALYARAPQAVAWYAAVPQPLIVFIGVCEVLGGIGLILPAMTGVKPKLTPFAAVGLALTMVLAAGFHVARGEYEFVPINLVLAGVAVLIAAGRLFLSPIVAVPISNRSVFKIVAVLAALALFVFAPTWYTMTHVQF